MAAGGRSQATRHEGFIGHRSFRWLWISLVVVAASIAGYCVSARYAHPAGNTVFGYASGTIGAVLILWLTALGLRKRLFASRGLLKGWVSAHVYLGLSLIVIVTLHSAFQFGWNIHTLAYGLLLGVIVSGVWGVTAYATLPASMSANRAELTQAQMLERLRAVNSRLDGAAQGLGEADAAVVRLSLNESRLGGGLLARLGVGAGRCGNRRALAAMTSRARLGMDSAAKGAIVTLLEEKESALRQIRRHIRLRTLLDLWLRVHVPLTVALLAALAAHIVSVFFYW